MLRIIFLFLIPLSSLAAAYFISSDVNGKWKGNLAPRGQWNLYSYFRQRVTLLLEIFRAQWESLSWSVVKVMGDSLSFDINFNGFIMSQTGKAAGDSIIISAPLDGQEVHVILKRLEEIK